MDSDFDNLPIIPHEHVADVDCCGCLMVSILEGRAAILRNECGAVIRTVPVAGVESTRRDLSMRIGRPDQAGVHPEHPGRRRTSVAVHR